MTLPVRASRLAAAAVLWTSLAAAAAAPAASAQQPSPEPSAEPSHAPAAAPAPSAAAAMPTEPSGAWRVAALDPWGEGLTDSPEDAGLTVVFLADNRLEGDTACGRYMGGYALEGVALSLGVVSQGYDACDQQEREQALGLSTALDTVTSWTATPSGLELLDEAGATRLVLVPLAAKGPVGTWAVVRFLRPSGRPARVDAEQAPLLTLQPDGAVLGSTGCRFFEGAWTSDGDSLDIGPLQPAGLPCDGPAGRDERQLLRALGEVVRWEREGQRLVLVDPFGLPAVELRADDPIEAPG